MLVSLNCRWYRGHSTAEISHSQSVRAYTKPMAGVVDHFEPFRGLSGQSSARAGHHDSRTILFCSLALTVYHYCHFKSYSLQWESPRIA
jgi:hypothetical protein